MEQHEVVAMLKRACQDAGSLSAWADLHNVSVQYVSDVLKMRRDPGDAVLAGLGLQRRYIYSPIHSEKPNGKATHRKAQKGQQVQGAKTR